MALGNPSVPADKCPSFPQSHSVLAVLPGLFGEPRTEKKKKNPDKILLFTRQSWVTTSCWTSHSFPSQAYTHRFPKNRRDCLPITRIRGWCLQASRKGGGVLWGSSPNTQAGSRRFLKNHSQGRRHRTPGLTAGSHLLWHSPTEHPESNLETKLIHVETAYIYLSEYAHMLFGLRKEKSNAHFAKGNAHTEAWTTGIIHNKLYKFFSLSGWLPWLTRKSEGWQHFPGPKVLDTWPRYC